MQTPQNVSHPYHRRSTANCRFAILLFCLALLAALAPSARATLLVYEGFDYTNGTFITGGNGGVGWTNAWSAGNNTTTNLTGSLSYADGLGNILITSGGRLFLTGANGNGTPQRDFALSRGTDNTTTWLSVLLVRTGPALNVTTNIYPRGANVSFYNAVGAGSTEIWDVGNMSNANTNLLSLMRGTTVAAYRPSTNPPTPYNQVNFAVVRIDHKAGNDYVWMWANPLLNVEPDTNSPSCQTLGEFDNTFNRCRPFAGNNNNTVGQPFAEMQMDELRIGDTYADVSPFISGHGKPATWQGAVSGDWDFTTANWFTNAGPATTFGNGDAVTFDDTGLTTNINIAIQVFPSSLTVTNNTKNYLFQGTGNLAGIYGITKQGTGKLTVALSDNSLGAITLLQGTLQIGNGGNTGTLGGGVLADNGLVVFNRSDNYTVNNIISGGGALTQNGASTLTLQNQDTYAGNTTVNTGGLIVNNFLSGGGTLTAAVGTFVGGHGSNIGPVVISGVLTPGSSSNAPGTFGAGGLTLSSGATVTLDLNTNNLIGGKTNDLVQVNGALNLNNNVLNVNFINGTVLTNAPYRLVNYTGAKSGSFNSTVTFPASRYTATLDQATANQINLSFAGTGPNVLLWNSSSSSLWDIGVSSNWNNLSTLVNPDVFYNFDNVAFDDTAAQNNVTLTQGLRPASMSVNNPTKTYVFGGPGKLTGNMSLVKNGAGLLIMDESGGSDFSGRFAITNGTVILARDNTMSGGMTIASTATVQVGTNNGSGSFPSGSTTNDGVLIFNRGADLTVSGTIAGASTGSILKTNAGILTLSGANTFTGAVVVANGTLLTANGSALGRTNGSTTVLTGATLDVGGSNLGGEPVFVSGAGVGGNGVIINNGAAQNNALRLVTMLGNSTFGGSNRWDIRQSGVGNDALLQGAFTVTKVGTNQVSLVGCDATTIGDVIVQQGLFGIEGGTHFSAGNITVSNGAAVEFFGNTIPLTRPLFLTGNGVNTTVLMNGGQESVQSTVTMAGTCVFSGTGSSLNLDGDVTGSASLLKSGSHRLIIDGSTLNYTGSTVITNGLLVVDTSKSGGTGITAYTGGFLGGGGSGHLVHENVVLNGGGVAPGNPNSAVTETLTIDGNVSMNGASNVFELNADTAVIFNDFLRVQGNLSMTGTNTFRIGVLDHLNVGDTYTLVSYNSQTGVASNNIVIVPPPFGYSIVLVDPATTPGTIQITVTLAIGFDFWTGADLVNPSLWDDNITTNWLRNGASTFRSNDFACFQDQQNPSPNPNSTNITLSGKLSVAGLIFTNATYSYKFVGSGSISGGEMILEGGTAANSASVGIVTIANSGSNDWTGGLLIDANPDLFGPARLYVGDGSVNGNLGSGTITNDGVLVFNHGGTAANPLTVNNNIVNGPDSGYDYITFQNTAPAVPMTNMGSGVVILGGNNTFSNELDITAGTVIANNGNALGSGGPAGPTLVYSGATLDVNGQSLPNEVIFAGGNGVGGNGALVNNSTNSATTAFTSVTLTTNTILGGISRWDIRNGLSTLATMPANSPYNITKIGTNQISLVGITNIDGAISNIDIQFGTFAIQTATWQLGDPRGTITVHTNANLNVWNLTDRPLNKKVVIQNGGAMWLESGTVTNIGLITLQGSNTFNMQGTRLTLQGNGVSGTANIYKIGGGTLEFATTNTIVGSLSISNGTVALVSNISLASFSSIDLSPADSNAVCFIDVTNRVDSTLTLASGQSLTGSGNVRGTLVVNSGATLSPGHSVGTVAATTNITLNGQTLMDIDAGAVTNDQIIASNILSGTGTLVVTKINGTLAAGQKYQLFRAGTLSTAFGTVTLPTLTGGLTWTNKINIDGSIQVLSPAITPPAAITGINFTGNNLVLNATNGLPGGTFHVLASTNVALAISNWTVITNGVFDGSGNLVNFTVINAVSGPQRFYLLQQP
jgi:autotransporter-associated beta strand protein